MAPLILCITPQKNCSRAHGVCLCMELSSKNISSRAYRIDAIKAVFVCCDFSFECLMSLKFSLDIGQISERFVSSNLKLFLNPRLKLTAKRHMCYTRRLWVGI